MPYLMGGFPTSDASRAIGDAYADNGADLVELGVPYSDPLADGPVIHAAGTQALRGGATLDGVLDVGGELSPSASRSCSCATPTSSTRAAPRRSPRTLAAPGVGGPDRPRPAAGGGAGVLAACDAAGIALVPLVAPTTPDERLARDRRPGPRLRLHGLGHRDDRRAHRPGAGLAGVIARAAHTEVPVAVGFGIATPAPPGRRGRGGGPGAVRVGGLDRERVVRACRQSGDGRARRGARDLRGVPALAPTYGVHETATGDRRPRARSNHVGGDCVLPSAAVPVVGRPGTGTAQSTSTQ